LPGNSTLIIGHACGGYSTKSFPSPLGASWLSKLLTDTYNTATYVRQCYGNSTSLGCKLYYQQSLPFSLNPNVLGWGVKTVLIWSNYNRCREDGEERECFSGERSPVIYILSWTKSGDSECVFMVQLLMRL
jgi:hypothetical protein